MEKQSKKIEWNEDDVIAFSNDYVRKVSLVLKQLKESIQYNQWGQNLNNQFSSKLNLSGIKIVPKNNYQQWFEEGIECQIMRASDTKGWRKGKIRVKLNIEFELLEETEESDSPLDHFRNEQQ